MRAIAQVLIVLTLVGAAGAVRSDEPDLTLLRCPSSATAQGPLQYKREHEVSVVGSDRATETVTDELTVVGRDASSLCFGLVTYARNGHMCGLAGVARAIGDGSFLFENGDVVIRLLVLTDAKIQVSPVGTGYRTNCGMYGVVESATYDLSMQANKSLERTRER